MSKIHRLKGYIDEFFIKYRLFGYKIALHQLCFRLFKSGYKSKHKVIIKYLENHYGSLINEYKQK